jgi:23S rRNA (cytosine1962-C5)-methyltransferase
MWNYKLPHMPAVTISRKGEQRVQAGHPWVYRSDVVGAEAVSAGDIVRVDGPRGRPLGYAFFSDRSQIVIRMIAGPHEEPSPDFWRSRIVAAAQYRESLHLDATACRIVHGEADRLPSLIVDRYGDYLVVQALSQAVDRALPEITRALVDVLHPAGILARNDPRVRLLEGLEQRVEVLHGSVPESIAVREGAVEYDVDPWHGQKTGLFLDQRENREAALRYARGRALDAFSYNGGFAMAIAPRCEHVLAVDISADAVTRIRANAARNGLHQIEPREMNVFDELRELERAGERFDTIVLDPPAFAKNKGAVPKALSGYKEINLRALKLLNSGGFLVTCSCSYNVIEAMFVDVVSEAAADAGATITVVEKRMQGRDHPVLLNVPETYYLKCLVLRKLA